MIGSRYRSKYEHVANTQYCVHYDEGMCKLDGYGHDCIHMFCPDYITKAGVRRTQEGAIRAQVEAAVINVRNKRTLMEKLLRLRLECLDIKVGSRIKNDKFGEGIVIEFNDSKEITIEFIDRQRTFQLDERSIYYFSKMDS